MSDKFNVKICNYNGVEIAINESILSNDFITTLCSTMKKHSYEKYINNDIERGYDLYISD